jgi:hypothetical protein
MWVQLALIAIFVGEQCVCERMTSSSSSVLSMSHAGILEGSHRVIFLERLRGGGPNTRDRKRAEKYQKLKQVGSAARYMHIKFACPNFLLFF